MDGRKRTVQDEIMRDLGSALKEQFGSDSRDLGVSASSYDRMWNSTYGFLSQICGQGTTQRLVRDSVGLVGNFARLVELCRLHAREDYAEKRVESSQVIGSEGVEVTEVRVVSKEAEGPLSQSILRPLIMTLRALRVSLSNLRKQYIIDVPHYI